MSEELDAADTEQQQSAGTSHHTITIQLPHYSDLKQIQVQATSLETVNDIKQSLIDLPATNQFTCFHLEYEGQSLNDFAELSSLEGLPEGPTFKLVEAPYTERDSRLHISRVLDFLAGNKYDGIGGETNFDHLQITAADPTPLVDYNLDVDCSLESLTTHDVAKIPQCLKSVALSLWNPAPPQYKTRGHLLYLVLNTLEGDNIHITSSVSGYHANQSTASKFDASQKPGSREYHSLLPLLKSLSPLFKKSYTALEKYMNTRDPILTVPVSNAHVAQSWISREDDHKPDPGRVQRLYLEQGFENNDSIRDWNEELQTTRELPVTPLPERIMRSRLLQKTLYDFSAAAARGAELLVKGELVSLNPTEEIEAQMYIYSNIFFSRGLDGVGTFIREGGDAAAHKAVALDVNGVRILSTLDVDGLSTLGTCVVDFAGERIVAQSIVPGIFRQRAENESQIIYGGVDGRDVVATDEKCEEIFAKVSAALRLRRHPVFEQVDDVRKELEMSIETKGLAGADGRTYVLDLYRLTPVDIEFLEQECAQPNESEFVSVKQSREELSARADDSYPHRMTLLRYELMEAYWESKLNDYVQNKLAAEDAAKTDALPSIEDSKSVSAAASLSANDEAASADVAGTDDKEPDTSADSDGFTKLESDGRVALNGAAETEKEGDAADSKERRIDISGFSLLFNPDTFHARIPSSASEEDVSQKDLDEALVRDVSKFLRDITIPKFVEDLREARVASPMDSTSLSKALHKRGINIRYLGKILQLAESQEQSGKHSALVAVAKRDVIARAVKHVLAQQTRGMPFTLLTSIITHFLNCLFSEEKSSPNVESGLETLYPNCLSFKKLTSDQVKALIEKEAYRRFRYSLSGNWLSEARGLPLLREICLQFGLRLLARDYFAPLTKTNGHSSVPIQDIAISKKGRKGKKEQSPVQVTKPRTTMFEPEDIIGIRPVIKDSTPRSGLAEEAMEAGRMSIVQGQKDLGMELLLESLSLHEQIYGVLHPEAARGYNALALIYSSLEDKSSAVELAKKAVVVAERTLGLDNSETILYYLNLALFEHANGNTKQALSYLQHALTQWRIIFGSNHPDMITTINNVAVMLQSLKLYPESLKWFESSVGICESVYGPESVNAATLYFQIAQAMALTGDHKSSINRMRDSHNIFKKEFGDENHNTKETHMWLTQLTQNAVQLAKQAKVEATRKGRRIGGSSTLASKVVSQPILQNQGTTISAPTTPVDDLVGTKGLQSIEELVKYISGDAPTTSTSTQNKKTSKKSVRRPMH